MSKRADAVPYLLLIAGIVGLVLIFVASRDDIYPWEDTRTRSPHRQEATATPAKLSSSAASHTPTPHAGTTTPADTATALPSLTATSTGTPPPTLTPTPTPIALSPPVVSSSGALAYVENGVLTVVEVNSSEVTTVAEEVVDDARTIIWSPNGQRLFYAVSSSESSTHGSSKNLELQVWDNALGRTVYSSHDTSGFPATLSDIGQVAWSPEGNRIFFRLSSEAAGSDGAWVLDVASARAWRLPKPVTGSAAWVDEETVLHADPEAITTTLVTLGPPAQIATHTITLTAPYSLSPGRDHVASFEGRPGEDQRLQVHPLPGRQQLSLSSQPAVTTSGQAPLWSPDGRWIAYGAEAVTSRIEEGPYTLLVDTEGLRSTQVFPGLLPEEWSPDSRFLAGFGCSDGTCSLSHIDASSGVVTNIASGESLHLLDLTWSPQGVYLAYSLSGSDDQADGLTLWNRATDERLLLTEGSQGQALTDLHWTADSSVLYAAQRQKSAELTVSDIWGIGPTWDDSWRIAPGFSEDPGSLMEALRERAGSSGEGPLLGPLLDGRRLIAYYGTPLGPGLGILGRQGITRTLALLMEQTRVYRNLDPAVETIPAFHMVTTIADDFPGPDGDYNHRVSHETVRRWVEGIDAAGGWSIVDLQPGRGNLMDEVVAVEPLLRNPNVHLAVDPEFIVNDSQVPGEDLGQITGSQINQVQVRLEQIARSTGQRKMLVIHQFDGRMVAGKEEILDYPLVDVVWDADGFGTPGSKVGDYDRYKTEAGFEYGGFKLFYEYDEPLMTPEEVLSLDPPPGLVIYQ